MGKQAELRYEDNFIRIDRFVRYDPGAYHDAEFDLAVCSDGFGGIAPCECRSEELIQLADELAEMYDFARKEVLLQDRLYKSCVKFELQRTGRVSASVYGGISTGAGDFSGPSGQAGEIPEGTVRRRICPADCLQRRHLRPAFPGEFL